MNGGAGTWLLLALAAMIPLIALALTNHFRLLPRLERAQQQRLVSRLVDYLVSVHEDPEDVLAVNRLLQQLQHEQKIKQIIRDFFNGSCG